MTDVTYKPNPTQPSIADRWNNAHRVFGLYHVRFDDGFNVFIPHTGWLNTVSQEPLDMDDEEHRAIIIEQADRVRMEHHTQADLDVLPTVEDQ